MKKTSEKLSEKQLDISLDKIDATIVYLVYKGFKLNTLLVS
jgi:hypothetical protein